MNFDNGQGLKFGVSNYGQGLANATNVCHFQYMGMGEAQGVMKPGQGIPQMPVDRNAFVPSYHNVGLAHHQGNPGAQAGFPMGVNISMSSPMSFNSLPPMESFGGHNQGFPPNQRPGMNYKNFNNWVGPNQSNQTSLPSIGHLWSHFQQQQIQKHTVQQPPPHQQNFYPNQQHMQGFQNTLALSPNMAGGPRGQNISYQYQAQNPTVVNHSRMYQNFPQERMQNCIYGSQNVPAVSQSVSGVNDQHAAKAPGQSHPVPHAGTPGPQVTAICNQVTKTTTTITMTNCNSSPLTTAMAHVNVTVPSVLTSVAVTKPSDGAGESPRRTPGVEPLPPVTVSGCASHHTKPKVSDGADSEGTECEQDSMESKDIEQSLQIVKVPFGWRRTTEDGAVVYYSPSNTRLCSYHEVCKYLSAEGTCKCGLECPLLVEKVFNFDPLVNGKLWTVDDMATGDLTKLCIHKRKIIAMATFQSSRSMSVSKATDKISHSGTGGHSKKGKKSKSKVNSTPYDGLLVSQLLAQKGKVKPPMNHTHKHTKSKGDGSQNPTDGHASKSSNNVTTVSNVVPKMFENKSVPCKSQALQQLQQLNKLNNSVGNVMPDPADDLGPITCQVPAKLDFSKEGFLEDQKNRLQTSMAGHSVGQAIFHQGSVSPQAPFSQDQLKHQLLMQQSASPCAPTASPSLVNSVPNHMYGPNVPQHFQCQLPMNMQQNSGNIMFQTLMHVQNPQAQRFTNPPVFEQANMQGNHLQVGSQPNLMINQGYPHLGNLTWLDPGKPKAKRPRSKKDKQKLNSILDRTSPCPNVDVRHIPQEASKNPSSISTSVSFMENPAAFLAQQTALVHSSLSSTKTDMSQPSPRTPQPSVSSPPSVSTSVQSKAVPVTTASSPASEPSEEVPDKVLPPKTCSISVPSATSSTSTGTVTTAKNPGLLKVDDGANCDRSDTPAIEKLNVSDKEASACEQCCDDKTRSSPASNATLPTDAKVNSLKPSETKDSDCVSENTTNNTKPNVSHQSQTPVSSNATIVTLASAVSAPDPTTTATNLVLPNEISELIAANNLNLNAVQQALSQQGPGEFPASTLLSAAARAQGSQQNPLNVLLGQPMQVSPTLQVPTGQETAPPAAIPDIMNKAGINTLDQLNLSLQQQGGGTLMLPQNPNILAGALPGGYINTLNGPTVQGLPLNMFLPVNQPIGNSTGLNPAQNVLIGLDPKSGANSQTSKQATTTGRVSGVETTKGLDGFNGPAVNFPTLFANVPGGPSTIGANMKLSTTSSSNASQVSAGVNASLLNNQFPYVTMNTPMPPMSLPLVTNVTNSLSQVIPAVGVPQTVLNQQPVTSLISTVTVPTLNNSVVITNQIPSMHTSQTGTQNIAFMGVQQPQGGESETNANAGTSEDVNSVGSSMASNETVCVSESGQANVPKLEAAHQGVETLMNKLVNQPTEVIEQMNNNTGQVVLLPNPNIPLLQLYGANPMLAAPGIDKFGLNSMQQVMLHGTMIDPQLCQGQAAVGGGLNLLQMQQMWNNAGNGNMTNLNAIQLQQLQALQLQLLLQQIQGMQSLVNQIQLQGAAQQTLNPDGTIPTQEVPTVGEVEDEVKVEVKEEDDDEEEEDGDTQDTDLSPSGECEFKSESDQNVSKNFSLEQPVNDNDVGYGVKDSIDNEVSQESKALCDATGAGANDITCSKSEDGDSLVKTSQTKKDQEFGVSENSRSDTDKQSWHNTDSDDVSSSTLSVSDSVGEQKSCDSNLLDSNKTGTALRTNPQKASLGEAEPPSGSNAVIGRGSCSSVLDGSAATASDLPLANHNGPEEDLCDDTDSLDDDMSLDDLRRGLKRSRTDDETDVDSTSIDNYDEESIDGMVSEGYLQNFSTGDVVWGQIRGFPLWPGKLVPESAAEGIELNPTLEDRADAVLVMWYGDHTFTRVEPQRLKTWGEGMVAHHKTRRKYRRGRKMNSHLEAAIQEAVKDIKDMPVVNSDTATLKPSVKGRATKKRKA